MIFKAPNSTMREKMLARDLHKVAQTLNKMIQSFEYGTVTVKVPPTSIF